MFTSFAGEEHQMTIFEIALESFIDMCYELALLTKQIAWDAVDSGFAHYYCADNGLPRAWKRT